MSADETRKGAILVVDDEVELMKALCESLIDQGYTAAGESEPANALERLSDGPFDLILSDLMMPKMDGIQLLRRAFEFAPLLLRIIMTGQGPVPTAVEAMKIGAFDYIQKPFKLQSILPILSRAMEVRRLRLENVRLKRHVERLTFESSRFQMVGDSAAMNAVVRMIEKVAATESTVLKIGRA